MGTIAVSDSAQPDRLRESIAAELRIAFFIIFALINSVYKLSRFFVCAYFEYKYYVIWLLVSIESGMLMHLGGA